MRIVIATQGLPFDGDTLKKQSLGGSETAVISLSNSLKKLGHNVTVYNNCETEGDYNGVEYLNVSRWREFVDCGYADVVIVSRFVQLFEHKLNSKLNILWNHDMMPDEMKDIVISATWNIDYMYCLSEYHKKEFIKQLPELVPIIKLNTNGIDFSLIPKKATKKHKIMFTSRPERGLYRALCIYEKLGDKDLELLICNYSSFQDKQVEQIEKLCANKINKLVNDGFNISIGSFPKDELYSHISESKAVIYPTAFPEISCISAIEAQACGTAYISTNDFALKETVAYSGINSPESKEYDDRFIERLKTVIYDATIRADIEHVGIEHSKKYTWANVAKKFNDDINEHFADRSKDADGVIDRLIYESDLVVAREIAKKKAIGRLSYINNLLRHLDNPESQKKIYEDESTHEKIDMDMKAIDKIMRFKWLSSVVKEHGVKSLLDYACHMGGSSIKVSNDSPDCFVTGFDLSEKAIEKASKRIDMYAKNKDKIKFVNSCPDLQFDAVFNGEMLEHVLDPEGMVDELEKHVKHGGKMFITVPKGAWEWLSRDTNKKMDVVYHVNNFDAQDIEHMFGNKKDFKVIVLPVNILGSYGEKLGNYLIEYTVDGTPTGRRDFYRKELTTRPHQSISLCMIGKDSHKTIEQTLDSLKDSHGNMIPDEMVLVDDNSKSFLMAERAASYGVNVYNLPKTITEPDLAGFAYARNFSVDKSTGKWILWIDTDEICKGFQYLRKYLECPLQKAFVIRQYHPQRDNYIQADTPQRIYRRGEGEFYGYIHEQVQADINNPIFPALTMVESEIWNMGSATEGERRLKSFDRNLQLLNVDWKVNVLERKKNGLPYRKLTPILVIRDLLNRANQTYEYFGTYKNREIEERILPRIMQLYIKYCKDETDPIYRDIAKKVMQQIYETINIGDDIDMLVNGKPIKGRYIDINDLIADIKAI